MNLQEMLQKDLASVCAEVGQVCFLKGHKTQAKVTAIVSDEHSANGGYELMDGRTVQASAQFVAGRIRDLICIGDSFIAGGVSYRVTNITKTAGDPSVTLSLSVEGKR